MDKNSAEKEYQKALRLHNGGKIREAELIYRRLAKAFPNLDAVWTNLGVTLYQQGKMEPALKALDKAIGVNPINLDAYQNRASVLMAMGRLEDASEAYRMVTTTDPKNANAHYNLGNVLFQTGRIGEAESAFKKAILANRNLVQAHYNLGFLLMQEGRPEEAAAAFRSAIGIDPTYVIAYVNLGNVMAEMGNTTEALTNFQLAIELDPGYVTARKAMARVLLETGEPDAALEELDKVLEAEPKDVDALTLKGNALSNLRYAIGARKAYREALAIDPQNVAARKNFGKAMANAIPRWHFSMLADEQRNGAYRRAIERAIKPGMKVLDIGAGSGLLSMMAAKAGAGRVDACEIVPEMAEVAKEVVAANGFADVVTIHKMHSSKLKLEEKADVLISEILDAGLIGEGVLPSHRHAVHSLLKPGAQVIPYKAVVYAQLVALPWIRRVTPMQEIEGFDLSAMQRFQQMDQYQSAFLDIEGWIPMSNPVKLWEVDFAVMGPAASDERPETIEMQVKGAENGMAHGVAFWFDLWLDKDEVVSSAPDGELKHWGQAVYFFPKDHEVRVGQEITLGALRTDTNWQFEWLG